ncbi:hypothetical protein [Streptomyces sp. NPDC086023]|uniref:hypothetical protein n=1 Tax=Streptomyces sp. NPDC086023 TaxID=3365746 RepID=UPI0037D6F221
MRGGAGLVLARVVALLLVGTAAVVIWSNQRGETSEAGIARALADLPNGSSMTLRVVVQGIGPGPGITHAPEGCETSPDRTHAVCRDLGRAQATKTVAGFGAGGPVRNQKDPCCWDQGAYAFWSDTGDPGPLQDPGGSPFPPLHDLGATRGGDWSVQPVTLRGEVGREAFADILVNRGEPATGQVWVELPEGVSLIDPSDRYPSEHRWCLESRVKPGWLSCQVDSYPLALSVRVDRRVPGAKGRLLVGWPADDPDPSNNMAEITTDFR